MTTGRNYHVAFNDKIYRAIWYIFHEKPDDYGATIYHRARAKAIADQGVAYADKFDEYIRTSIRSLQYKHTVGNCTCGMEPSAALYNPAKAATTQDAEGRP